MERMKKIDVWLVNANDGFKISATLCLKRSLTYLDLIVGSIIPKMMQMVWLIRSAWLVSFAKALPTSTSLIYTTTPLENLTTVTQLGTYHTTAESDLWLPTFDLKFTTTVMISIMTNEQLNPKLFDKYRWNKHRTWSRLARWKYAYLDQRYLVLLNLEVLKLMLNAKQT